MQWKGSMKETDMFHNYETERITRKARKPAVIAGVTTEQHVITAVFFISQWHGGKPAIITCWSVTPPEIVMHDAYIGGRSEYNIWRAGCSQLEYVDIRSAY